MQNVYISVCLKQTTNKYISTKTSRNNGLIKPFPHVITITLLQVALELRFRAPGSWSRLEIDFIVRNVIVGRRWMVNECGRSHLAHFFCWTWISCILLATPKGAHHTLALDLDSAAVKEFELIVLLPGKLGGRFGAMDAAFSTRRLHAGRDIHGITKETESGVSRTHHI